MKLFFLFTARRERKSNLANVSYDTIEGYTAIARHRIESATSLLAVLSIVYVEQTSTHADFGFERVSDRRR